MHNNLKINKRTFTESEIEDLARIAVALKQLTKHDILSCSNKVVDCVDAGFEDRIKIESKASELESIKKRNAN